MLATTVHTTGINWLSLLSIIGTLTTVVGGFTSWIVHRIERQRRLFLAQIEDLSKGLEAHLIRIQELAEGYNDKIGSLSQSLARIEGKLR